MLRPLETHSPWLFLLKRMKYTESGRSARGGEGLGKKILQLGSEPVETDHETT